MEKDIKLKLRLSRMNRSLRRPHMGSNHRNLLRDIPKYRHHKFCIFLVGSII